jgi:arabinan endo-1,5-alpha-L-arabinosidase
VTRSPGRGLLYYGSYYGGIFATKIDFTETSVRARTADTTDDTRITIGNRYEGANVV